MKRAVRNRNEAAGVRGRDTAIASSRQRERKEATRSKLLAAGEAIFARDGFEAARLEDIAAEAGYTRGAFYANFKSKEDIFFALLEMWVAERMAEVDALIEKYETPKKRLEALREMYAQFARNRRLALLSLEFKLYAIRHPRAQARLRAWNRTTQCSKKEMLERIAPAIGRNLSASGPAISTALGAFSHALLLEHLVDPAAMPSDEIQELLKSLFETIVAPRGR